MTRQGDRSDPTLTYFYIKETIVLTLLYILCPGACVPFHWFNRYAYLKLGVSVSCQLVVKSINKISLLLFVNSAFVYMSKRHPIDSCETDLNGLVV